MFHTFVPYLGDINTDMEVQLLWPTKQLQLVGNSPWLPVVATALAERGLTQHLNVNSAGPTVWEQWSR